MSLPLPPSHNATKGLRTLQCKAGSTIFKGEMWAHLKLGPPAARDQEVMQPAARFRATVFSVAGSIGDGDIQVCMRWKFPDFGVVFHR